MYRGDAINNLYELMIDDFDPEMEDASIEALIYDRDYDRVDYRPDEDRVDHRPDEDRVDHRPDFYSVKV